MTASQFENKMMNLALWMYIGGGVIGVLVGVLALPWPVMILGGLLVGGLVGELGRRYTMKIVEEVKEKGVV